MASAAGAGAGAGAGSAASGGRGAAGTKVSSAVRSGAGISRAWKEDKKHVTAYTGGPVVLAPTSESFLLASCANRVSVVDLNTGLLQRSLQDSLPEERREPILAFAMHPTDKTAVTASRSLVLRSWDLVTGETLKVFRGPKAPVVSMAYDPTGTLVATGAADASVMVWDVDKRYCTHSFKGHGGVVTLVQFHPNPDRLQLFSCSEDTDVRVWDLVAQECTAVLTQHFSLPTCLGVGPDGWTLVTGSRDKVLHVWDLRDCSLKLTYPVFEAVEGLQMLTPSEDVKVLGGTNMEIATVGDKGLLRVWHLSIQGVGSARKYSMRGTRHTDIKTLLTSSEGGQHTEGEVNTDYEALVSHQASHLLYRKQANELICVTRDHNFVLADAESLRSSKVVVGNNDDIIGIRYIPSPPSATGVSEDSRTVAIASNSQQLRLFNMDTFGARILEGHLDTILCVDPSPDGAFVATASKDRTARVWHVESGKCVAVCEGHTAAVGAVTWPRRARTFRESGTRWIATASKDLTLKLWDMSSILKSSWRASSADEPMAAHTTLAVKAHAKDINALAVSPNDQLIASGSQDKTVKLWSSSKLAPVATLSGHKRGIWAVEFSPVDRCLASASGDRTVRIWSAVDFTCIKRLEGHTASVLCLKFIRAGMQLLTGGADGLVKLWTIKDSECINTFEGHSDKVWALAVTKHSHNPSPDRSSSALVPVEEEMITGGGDGTLILWSDATTALEEEEVAAAEETLLAQQELFNKMAARDYSGAINLCIKLEQPGRLLAILTELLEVGPTKPGGEGWEDDMRAEISEHTAEASGQTWKRARDGSDKMQQIPSHSDLNRELGEAKLCDILRAMPSERLEQLLLYIREWNTQSRHNLVAQHVLNLIIKVVPMATLKSLPAFSDLVTALLPYTQKHFERMDRMLQQSYFLDYTLTCLRQLAPSLETHGDEEATGARNLGVWDERVETNDEIGDDEGWEDAGVEETKGEKADDSTKVLVGTPSASGETVLVKGKSGKKATKSKAKKRARPSEDATSGRSTDDSAAAGAPGGTSEGTSEKFEARAQDAKKGAKPKSKPKSKSKSKPEAKGKITSTTPDKSVGEAGLDADAPPSSSIAKRRKRRRGTSS